MHQLKSTSSMSCSEIIIFLTGDFLLGALVVQQVPAACGANPQKSLAKGACGQAGGFPTLLKFLFIFSFIFSPPRRCPGSPGRFHHLHLDPVPGTCAQGRAPETPERFPGARRKDFAPMGPPAVPGCLPTPEPALRAIFSAGSSPARSKAFLVPCGAPKNGAFHGPAVPRQKLSFLNFFFFERSFPSPGPQPLASPRPDVRLLL